MLSEKHDLKGLKPLPLLLEEKAKSPIAQQPLEGSNGSDFIASRIMEHGPYSCKELNSVNNTNKQGMNSPP